MLREDARIVYEQYMLHARHSETQRLSFANIYAIIVAGLLVFGISSNIDPNLRKTVFFFLLFLSVFGYLITKAWNDGFMIWSRLAEQVAIDLFEVPSAYQRFAFYKKKIRASRIFIFFYSIMCGFYTANIYSLLISPAGTVEFLSVMIIVTFTGYILYIYQFETNIQIIKQDSAEPTKSGS